MTTYRLVEYPGVRALRLNPDGSSVTVPDIPHHPEAVKFEQWLVEGNQPEPFETEAEQAQRLWTELRNRRDQKLLATDWLTRRHEEQLAASLNTSLSGAQYQELLAYRQTLRDLPEKAIDPGAVEWPSLSF